MQPLFGVYIGMKLLGAPRRCNVTAVGVGRAGGVAEFSRGICDVNSRKPGRSEVTHKDVGDEVTKSVTR